MSKVSAAILLAAIIQLALGAAVFQANPRRKPNQIFLLLCFAIEAWLLSLYGAFNANTPELAELSIREASASGVAILIAFDLLRVAIREKEKRWGAILRGNWVWMILGVGMIAFCQSEWFLKSALLSSPIGVSPPTPVYGPGGSFYAVYFAAAVVALILNALRDLRRTSGPDHAELAVVLAACVVAVAIPLLASFVLRLFLDPSWSLWLAPFRAVIFGVAVGYGIATRKVLEVGFFVRRVIAFMVLCLYLIALYGLVWWTVSSAARLVAIAEASSLGHVLAALVVAFAMTPAHGISQSLANRLFVGTRGLDFRSTVNEATTILRSVTTLKELLERFAKTIGAALDTERVLILLPGKGGFAQHYPEPAEDERAVELAADHPMIVHLSTRQEMIVVDELQRVRTSAELDNVRKEMIECHLAVAVGIFSREHLAGLLLLGTRRSGRVYGSVEQNALQVLCGQLAVAIENAQLFTEVQNAKIYNEILLQNLTTGVIAADADGRISVFNNEAESITSLKAHGLIDQPIVHLPEEIRAVLSQTLNSGKRQENREIVLQSGEESVTVRASSSTFHGQSGEMLGALMVLTDITAVKRLEQQIRRSDRLASLGTLSAGMAHEIKNPLVSIKTFAQLLPERYQDSDFRETFSNLIGHEINRIDSLVNQLLRFARPAKPLLKPMHVHDVLEKSLMLVGHRLYQKEIKLSRVWNAEVDTIRADADQLEQVFLNFFLNAMDAMKRGGELTVATEIQSVEEWMAPLGAGHEADELLRITVQDDGEGIKSEDIAHVFDPFFTTKDYGTGLGLSVVHGIIQEHGGQIEVESEPTKGTSFHILLPLVRFEEEVAAA